MNWLFPPKVSLRAIPRLKGCGGLKEDIDPERREGCTHPFTPTTVSDPAKEQTEM